MLLILTKSNEMTSAKVIRFLENMTDFTRINDNKHIEVSINDKSDLTLVVDDGRTIEGKRIKRIWYRTGNICSDTTHPNPRIHSINIKESSLFKEYLIYLLEHDFDILGAISAEFSLNKLVVLSLAKKLGLKIPASLVTNRRNIRIEKQSCFVKSVGNIISFEYQNFKYFPVYDMLHEDEYCDNSISFFQNYIDKEFEVRSFFLYGQIYSMAIFSQSNPETRLDFRNHDRENPNRNVPFTLPTSVSRKINTLMRRLKMNTGSIDLICSKTGEFVFLEINPSGQFEWLSLNCNYYLEKKIAAWLNG